MKRRFTSSFPAIGARQTRGNLLHFIRFNSMFSLFSLVTIFRSGEDWLVPEVTLMSPNFRHSSTGLKHQKLFCAKNRANMRVEFNTPELAVEPRVLVQYEHVLRMALRPGWVEIGQRRPEMKKTNFVAGEMVLCPRIRVWLGAHDLESLKSDHF